MKARRSNKIRNKEKGIQWNIVLRVLKIGVPVILILFAALWYLLEPHTQYRFRRWYLSKRYGNLDAYYPQRPVIPYSYSPNKSSTYQVQYLYRLNTASNTLQEIYRRERVEWPATARIAGSSMLLSDGSTVALFDQASGKTVTLYSPKSDKERVHVLASPDGGAYIATVADPNYEWRDPYGILALDVANRTTKVLGSFAPGVYEVPNTVLTGDPFLITGGGDGCGGKNRVYSLMDGKQKTITEFGIGCVEGPRYIGLLNNGTELLAAAVMKPDGSNEFTEYCRYDVMYSYALENGTVTPILDLKSIPGCIKETAYDPVSNHAVVITDSTVYLVDIAARAIVRTFDNPTDQGFNFELYSGYLVGYSNKADSVYISVTDISTGETDKIPWDFRLGRFPTFVGRLGGDIFIHTLETRTE